MNAGSPTPRVEFGLGSEAQVVGLLSEAGATRVLVVSTGRRAVADRVADAMGGLSAGVYAGAVPHVPRSTVDAALALVARARPDWVLAVGGGTPIGLAKAIALERPVSIAALPTTYAGSEMTSIWGISHAGAKNTGRDPRCLPRLVAYAPSLAVGLPSDIRRHSLYNALAHSIEGLWAVDSEAALRDRAEASISHLMQALRGLQADATDLAAVAIGQQGASMAGDVLARCSMAVHHKLCHVLGGSFGAAHAATHARLLPYSMAFNQRADPDAFVRLQRVFGSSDPAGSLWQQSRELGMRQALSIPSFGADQVPQAVAIALRQPCTNPRPLTQVDVSALLLDAIAGRPPGTSETP
jgi:maleylacetate reductase